MPDELAVRMPDILAAVKSLYADELKPCGRVLLKRLRQRAMASWAEEHGLPAYTVNHETFPRVNPKSLRKLCAACRQLIVSREELREYSVTFAGHTHIFVDVSSPADSYPPELWEGFASFLGSLGPHEMALAGGRYECAQMLISCQLPFLVGLSLGRVCHIVQLATTQRMLLGYYGGWLVPYKMSDNYVRMVHASARSPTGAESFAAISTWGEIWYYLQQLLSCPEHSDASHGITVSNLKPLLKLHFGVHLSETAFGYERLQPLLQDPRLQDICSVQLQGDRLLIASADVPGARPSSCPSITATAAAGAVSPVDVVYVPLPARAPLHGLGAGTPSNASSYQSAASLMMQATEEVPARESDDGRKGSQSAGSTAADGEETGLAHTACDLGDCCCAHRLRLGTCS